MLRKTPLESAGGTATYAFDATGRLASVTFGSQTASWSHNSLSRRTGQTNSNGTSIAFAYEIDSDLSGLTPGFSGSSTPTSAAWTHGYDGREAGAGVVRARRLMRISAVGSRIAE